MIGPTIPQELLEKKRAKNEKDNESATTQVEESSTDPLQSEPVGDDAVVNSDDNEDDPDAYAPALPPDLLEARRQQKEERAVQVENESGRRRRRAPVGPTMPSAVPRPQEEEEVIGPVLPSNYDPEKVRFYISCE